MINESNTVDTVEDTITNDDSVVDLSQMSREEVEAYAIKNAKAFNDQKGLNAKLKSKVKETTDVEPAPVEASTADTPDIAPEPETAPTTSLDEQYVIADLSKRFSLEEIKEAQSFVGTSFGVSLSDVASNPGFLAHVNASRELTKSDSMMNDDPIHIDTFQSKEQFVRDVESGDVDLTADPEARAKYIEIKAKQEADKHFIG